MAKGKKSPSAKKSEATVAPEVRTCPGWRWCIADTHDSFTATTCMHVREPLIGLTAWPRQTIGVFTRYTHSASGECTQVVQKVTALKNEGNKMFAERDYTKAIEQYEEAMQMLPDGAAERADLLCNKAACFYAVNK